MMEDYFFWQQPSYLDTINGGEVTATPLTNITYTVTAMTTIDNDLGCCSTLEVNFTVVPIELGCACDIDATHCDGYQGLMPVDLPAGATYYFKQLNTLAVYSCTEGDLPLIVPVGPYQMAVEINGVMSDYSSNTKTVALPIVPCIPRLENTDSSSVSAGKLSVYPNPAFNQFTIVLELPANNETVPIDWELKNLYGIAVQAGRATVTGGRNTLPVTLINQVPDGIYLLQVLAGSKRFYSSITFNH